MKRILNTDLERRAGKCVTGRRHEWGVADLIGGSIGVARFDQGCRWCHRVRRIDEYTGRPAEIRGYYDKPEPPDAARPATR